MHSISGSEKRSSIPAEGSPATTANNIITTTTTSTPPAPTSPKIIGRKGQQQQKNSSWSHLLGGAFGGTVTAVVTSPLDVLRTRLQSDFYKPPVPTSTGAAASRQPVPRGFLHQLHPGETVRILGAIHRTEGWRGFFRGLGPSLTGVVPASSVKFYTYGNCKRLMTEHLGYSRDSAGVHGASALSAAIVTSTVTNPIWLVKTRLQLDKSQVERRTGTTGGEPAAVGRQYKNSLDCVRQVVRNEGIGGLYRGLTASYLGSVETTLHFVLYEQLRRRLAGSPEPGERRSQFVEWLANSGSSGLAKVLAVLATYPHEVVRTRLRQAPEQDGRRKYTGLAQCFVRVWREEGVHGLYGGLAPHLLRSAPSAAVMLGVYEFVVRVFEKR